MKIIGITGGIGSGKTTIAKIFESFGIPVYYADIEAKALMNRSKIIKRKLIQLLGESAYIDEEINRKFISSKVFNNNNLLKKVNEIVHPKVSQHFKRWLKKQNAPFILKESAIIFENNLQNNYDAIILVVADMKQRIKRVMERDQTSKDKVISIIEKQLPNEIKIPLSSYVIENNSLEVAKSQAIKLYNLLLK